MLRPVATPFAATGGLTVMKGNLGRGVIKVSAVAEEHRVVEAPAKIFEDQNEMKAAFESGELDRDVIVVVRFRGPKANGMPELHKLTPFWGCCRTVASRSRWSPMAACPVRRAKCLRPFT